MVHENNNVSNQNCAF